MKFLAAAVTLFLAACASSPPLPKAPDESHRVPLNKALVTEAGVATP